VFWSYSHPNIYPSEAFANVPYLTQSYFQPCSHIITKCSESDSFPPKDLVSIQPYFSITYLGQSNGARQTYNVKTHGLLATSGLASSPGHSPRRVALYSLFAHVRNIPGFYGIRKITNIYCTLSTYTIHICSFYVVDRQRRHFLEQVIKRYRLLFLRLGRRESC